jgi:hypothetical protein
MINGALPVQTSAAIRPGGPSLDNVRHRGANPAVIGGPGSSDSSNTGAVNGTRMKRKP